MIRLVIFLIFLSTISVAILWFDNNHGTVTVSWLGYRAEASIFSAAVLLITVIIASVLITELFIFIKNIPSLIARKRSASRGDKTLLAITRTLASMAIGDVSKAQRNAREVEKLMRGQSEKNRLIAHMLMAESAHMNGDNSTARKHFSELIGHNQTEFVAVRGLLAAARKEGDLEKALELAEKAHKMNPGSSGAIKILLNLYKQTAKWEKAQAFIDKIRKKKIFSFSSNEAGIDIEYELAVISLMRAKNLLKNGDEEQALELAEKAIKSQPDFVPAILFFVALAEKFNKKRKAVGVIERAWKTNPHPKLRECYLDLYSSSDTNEKSLKRAMKLLSVNSDHQESHRAVAEAALKTGDTTLARNHAKMAMANGDNAELCSLMADIERADGADKEIINQWITKAKYASSQPGWSCKECLAPASEWQIQCDSCGAVDCIEWGITHSSVKTEKLSNFNPIAMLEER